MSAHHPTFLSGPQVREVIKPLVEYLQQELLKLYPEMDFVFADDEFARDVPGDYRIRLAWFVLQDANIYAPLSYRVRFIELIRPTQIQREVLQILKWSNTESQPFMKPLVPFFAHRISYMLGTAEAIIPYEDQEYQFIW